MTGSRYTYLMFYRRFSFLIVTRLIRRVLLALNELSKQQHKHYLIFLTLYLASTPLVTKNVIIPLLYKFY